MTCSGNRRVRLGLMIHNRRTTTVQELSPSGQLDALQFDLPGSDLPDERVEYDYDTANRMRSGQLDNGTWLFNAESGDIHPSAVLIDRVW